MRSKDARMDRARAVHAEAENYVRIGKGVQYFGSLKSPFARKQRWGNYDLAIVAGVELKKLKSYRNLTVLSYTHWTDEQMVHKIDAKHNHGIFMDWGSIPPAEVARLKLRLPPGKVLAVNTGWGSNPQTDYGPADIVMVESFIGSHKENDKYPAEWVVRESKTDMTKVFRLRQKGYKVIALSYGPSEDATFRRSCRIAAANAGADYFIYTQPPGWEKDGSGFRFWHG